MIVGFLFLHSLEILTMFCLLLYCFYRPHLMPRDVMKQLAFNKPHVTHDVMDITAGMTVTNSECEGVQQHEASVMLRWWRSLYQKDSVSTGKAHENCEKRKKSSAAPVWMISNK